MFKPLGSLLPEALGRLRVRKPVEASLVCRAADNVLQQLWDHAVPMRAVSYRAGVVTVAVTSSSWGHEVRSQGERLKEKTNKALSGAVVTRIKTRVAPRTARGEGI